jgi:hypothetical protein
MHQATKTLAQASEDLTSASLADYSELLAKRRVAVDALAGRQGPSSGAEELASALRCGRAARSRLLVELGALRTKIEELRRLHAGLGQLRPIPSTPPSLDLRL